MENIQNSSLSFSDTAPEEVKSRATVALSLIVHGEAVRYNRGKLGTSGNNLDFKHLQGPRTQNNPRGIYPYVSAQCFKKHWRETLPFTPSPIIREKDSRGQEKNQAYTSGDPMKYVDDDLFGYMIAGAAETESEEAAEESEPAIEAPDDQDAKRAAIAISPDQLKGDKTWIKLLKDDSSAIVRAMLEEFPPAAKEEYDSTPDSANLSDSLRQAITDALNQMLDKDTLYNETHFPDLGKKAGKKQADALKIKNDLTVRMTRLELLQKAFTKGFEAKKKRDTTRRTAPVRMHALVAFSGIKMAEDFQTFSRDVALTGKNSILNPNPVGIYSGWLKTRVLIEAFRVGKFFIGGNMDILEDQIGENQVETEANPYDRQNGVVRFVQIADDERKKRVGVALESLGNIGNVHGPASSALHDGSLKPRAFIGAALNCADSPFDSVWEDNDGTPRLSLSRLKAVLRDWEDLFQDKTLYIGISSEMLSDGDVESFGSTVNESIEKLGFKAIVDTPRRALKTMAQQIVV